jgi:glucokinase
MSVKMGRDVVLAVDIGGSKVAFAFIDSSGNLQSEVATLPVPFDRNGVADVNALLEIFAPFVKKNKAQAIGISLCGNVDLHTGTAILVPNLHWKYVPFGNMLSEKYGLPVFAATDVRQALLAELIWGKAQNRKYIAWGTIGTGYGGYLFLDGKLYGGFHGFAGNFGHNSSGEADGFQCGCGKKSCVETFVSGPAIARAGQKLVDEGKSLILMRKAADGKVTTRMVFEAEAENDLYAVEIINDVIRRVSISLSGLVNILDLEMIVLGGGVVKGSPGFVNRVSNAIRPYLMTDEAKRDLRIEGESFDNSARIGAGAYAFDMLGIIKFWGAHE